MLAMVLCTMKCWILSQLGCPTSSALRRGSGAQGEVCGRELVVDAAPFGLVVGRAGGRASSEVGLLAAGWGGLCRSCAGGVDREVDSEDGEFVRGVGAGRAVLLGAEAEVRLVVVDHGSS